VSDTTDERAKYETFLRLTKKRVRRDADDHDRALIGQGQTALLDRRDALIELKKRVNKAITSRVDLLDGEERSLRSLSKEKKREELRDAHVILDSRQGGVILVRDAETHEVLLGPTPLSASQREVFAATRTQTNLFEKDPVAANEELAKKLNLMEYLADDPPATVRERVAAALDAGDLPDDLKTQLMDFLAEDEANREEAGPTPKAKKEKPAKEPKKRGRPKKSESAPATSPPAPTSTDEQPGPTVEEKDVVLPKSPPKPKAKLSDEPAEGDRIPLVGEEGDDAAPTMDGSREGLVEALSQRVAEHDEDDAAEDEEEPSAPADEPAPDDGDLAAIPDPEEPEEPLAEEGDLPEAAGEEPAEGDDEIPDYEATEADSEPEHEPEPQHVERFVEAEESEPVESPPATTEPAPVVASPEPTPDVVEPPTPALDVAPVPAPVASPEPVESPPEAAPEPKRKKRETPAPAPSEPKASEPELTEENHWGMPAMNAKQLTQASEAAVKNLVFFSPILIEQIETEMKSKMKAETMRKAMPIVFRDLAKKGAFTARSLPNGDTAYYMIVKTGAKPKNLTADRVEATIAAYLKGERDPAKLKSAGAK